MSSIPYPLDPMGSTNRGSYFELVVKPGILASGLTYGFTPSWSAGGYCKVVDWGDGSNGDAVTSGALIKHTYAAAGTYTILIKAYCYKCMFGYNNTYAPLIYDANGNWDALGNITNGSNMFQNCTKATLPLTSLPDGLTNATGMFQNCTNATLPLTSLPAGLTRANSMFYRCTNATLPLTSLPDGLTRAVSMFRNCTNATLPLTSLPDGLTSGSYMFIYCKKAVINLDELAANAPEGGWTGVTSIESMFYNAGSGNSPGTVTGSRSAFLSKLPNVTDTTDAFYGTNTTE